MFALAIDLTVCLLGPWADCVLRMRIAGAMRVIRLLFGLLLSLFSGSGFSVKSAMVGSGTGECNGGGIFLTFNKKAKLS
jgi:hypothetical protein